MTVQELINILVELDPCYEVKVYNPNAIDDNEINRLETWKNNHEVIIFSVI